MKDSVSGIQSLNRRLVVREDETMEETTVILSELGLCGNVDFVRMVNARLSNKYYQNLFDLNNKYHVLNEVVKDRRSGGNVKELQRKLKQMRWADERLFQQKFDGIIDSIRKVLEQSGTPIDRFALEYHVLEATEILCSLKIFQDNMASLKTIAPVITGRNLRNYLAHDPLAYDALAGSCSTIESNAMFFVQNRVKLYQSKVVPGRSKAVCNFIEIFERKVAFTNEQQNVFEAVKAFDVSKLRRLVSKDKTLLLGRTQLDSDLLSIALNGDPRCFIDQLLNSHGDNNFFRYFLETSTNVALKQKLAHILKDPHQFCYLTAVRFELIDTLLLLRLHPQVDPTLSDEALVSIFAHYSPDSLDQLLQTFPVEQFLRDQRLQNSILHWAVLRGDLQLVRCALHRHRTLLNECNVLGESPLALAVRYGFRDVARLLIEHGADVLRSKWTPVWIAACLGDLEMVRMLLAGEVISGRNNPLVAAVEHDQLEVFAYLHESCGYSLKGDCLLHKAVQLGRVRFVRYFVESEEGSMLIDGLNTFCFTALMTAAACGRFDLFLILVQSGADPYFSNEFGYNVLHCAVYTGKWKIVDYLLQLPEMDVNARTADGLNALGIAIGQNNLAMVEYLLGKNSEPTASHVLLAGYYKRYNSCECCLIAINLYSKPVIILKLQEVSSDEEEMVVLEVEDESQKKWDCESILSTYSNIYNHPKLIEEPRKAPKISINPKTGLPMNVLGADGSKLTVKSLAKLGQDESPSKPTGPKSLCDGSVISTLSVLSIRPKDETPEEKRERKKLLKEYRAERRIERKANTLAFKEEKKQQEKSQQNSRVNAGVRIV
ncbi:hypothetical protein pipiens_000830, partial [Culex pipiens pipiens]